MGFSGATGSCNLTFAQSALAFGEFVAHANQKSSLIGSGGLRMEGLWIRDPS